MKKITLSILILTAINSFAQSEYDLLVEEGFELLQKRDVFKAIEKYKLALKANDKGLDANYGIAVCYSSICIQNGSYCMDAIDHFLIVEQVAGGYRSTFRNVSTCYIKTYQYEKAITYCNKAIAQNPKDGESYFYRGVSKAELKRTEEACKDLHKSLKLGITDARQKLQTYCK